MRHMAQLQETKYKSQGREVPKELQDQIENMVMLEKEVTATMKTKEEELLHLKADRQDYNTELKLISTWLAQAKEQLEERIVDIPEAVYRHEVSYNLNFCLDVCASLLILCISLDKTIPGSICLGDNCIQFCQLGR